MRVLIIEDTRERLNVLKKLYRAHAWVDTAVAHHAMRLVRSYKFDIISLDYNLNGPMTGADIARTLPVSPNSESTIVVHSLNPRGVEKISEYLPGAIIYPVSRIAKSNRHFKMLRDGLDEFGPRFQWPTW